MIYTGRIIKGIGGFYYVKCGEGLIECKAAGRFRKEKIVPTVGDIVKVRYEHTQNKEEYGLIIDIFERKNRIARPPISNIDCLIVIIAAAAPEPNLTTVDKVICIAESCGIDVKIVITKTDLDPGDELYRIYTNSGFETVKVCVPTGIGIDLVKDLLVKGVNAFTGNSGVGKSTLLNAVIGSESAQVGEISKKISRGKNTTRHVEIYEVAEDVFIADTPGFSSFELDMDDNSIKSVDLAKMFREFSKYLDGCYYTDCSHTSEHGCKVIEGVKNGEIEKTRYNSYCGIFSKLKELEKNIYR